MPDRYDLVVIGSGAAGSTPAARCRAAGWSVAVVDERPFGGTCALRGCDPKKVLVGAAETVDRARRLAGRGVVAGGAGLDWPSLARFTRSFTDPVPAAREKGLADRGVAVLHGSARFLDPQTVDVEGRHLHAGHVVVATGAHPAPLGIPGEALLTTSDAFLELEELPRRIVFVGGGYVSFELAHVAARAGAQVCILESGPRPLAAFDPDLVEALLGTTERLGVDVRLDCPVRGVERRGNRLAVLGGNGHARETFDADMVVHGAGRTPAVETLDLAAGDVETERGGIAVNEYLQSVSNPAVFAGGDAAASPGPPLTPVADAEGALIADNLLDEDRRSLDYAGIPSVLFTVPPLARVGLGEAEAREQGFDFEVHRGDTADWYTARRVGAETSGYKVLVDRRRRTILGAHLIGPGADEVINLFAVAVRFAIPAEALRHAMLAYPTAGSDIAYMV